MGDDGGTPIQRRSGLVDVTAVSQLEHAGQTCSCHLSGLDWSVADGIDFHPASQPHGPHMPETKRLHGTFALPSLFLRMNSTLDALL